MELKVVEHILEVHKAQLLSYLKLANKEVGLLINFNVVHLRDGIRRLVNHYQCSASSVSSAVLVRLLHPLQTRNQFLRQAFI